MTLTPELQKMFEEKTKRLSSSFHEANCCYEQIRDFDKLKECLGIAKQYINHFQDYYFPMIQKAKGLESMVLDLKEKQNSYLHTCHEFSDISNDADLNELSECLKTAGDYIQEIESNLNELGFKLS